MLITRLNEKGLGISGKKEVMKAYPGDEITAVKQGKYWHVKEVLKAGEHRTKARCRHFAECNACIWQEMKYESQLAFKQERIEKLFGSAEKIEASPRIWNYRNKMELVFLNGKLGYRAFGKWYLAFDLEECAIAMEWMPEAVKKVRKVWKESKIPEYDFKTGEGMLRYLVLRGTRKEKLAAIVATSKLGKEEAEKLLSNVEVDSKFLLINDSKSDVAYGRALHIAGKKEIEEEYLGYRFRFGPLSFMQPNPWQAEKLYRFVKEIADLKGNERVVELYGGVGVIGILLANEAKEVVSVEENEEASKLAEKNAEINGVRNFKAVNARAEEVEIDADLLVVDPPRSGMHTSIIRKIIENPPRKIVYVSCNPKTQWRDIQLLPHRIKIVKPFDMLPHTPHIENVILLEIP